MCTYFLLCSWDRKNNPEPWQKLGPTDQYKVCLSHLLRNCINHAVLQFWLSMLKSVGGYIHSMDLCQACCWAMDYSFSWIKSNDIIWLRLACSNKSDKVITCSHLCWQMNFKVFRDEYLTIMRRFSKSAFDIDSVPHTFLCSWVNICLYY